MRLTHKPNRGTGWGGCFRGGLEKREHLCVRQTEVLESEEASQQWSRRRQHEVACQEQPEVAQPLVSERALDWESAGLSFLLNSVTECE